MITVKANELREILARTACSRGKGMPLVTHALFAPTGKDNMIAIISTDMEAEVYDTLLPESGEMAPAAIHVESLTHAITGMEGDITLEATEDDRAVVRQGRKRFTVPALPAAEFAKTEYAQVNDLGVSLADLQKAIDCVSYAAPKNDVRYFLNGVCLQVGTVVACDGHRIAVCPLADLKMDREAIIPVGTLGRIKNLISEGRVALCAHKDNEHASAIRFYNDRTMLTCRLIDGKFPDWKQIAKPPTTKGAYVLTFAGDEMGAALSRMIYFGSALRMSMKGEHELHLLNKDANDLVAVEKTGEMPDLGMTVKYLADVIGRSAGSRITMKGEQPDTQQFFYIDGCDDYHIIMPVRL